MSPLSDPVLTALGFGVVFALLGLAELAKRLFGVGEEGTRKLVHIGVGHWMLVAIAIRDVRWAVIAPAAFILLNYLSYRKGLFGAMERTKGSGGLGTVYYSVSLTILVLWLFREGQPRWPAVAGILTMAWGDGLAAVVGERWGRHPFDVGGGRKSLEGSAAMFLATVVVIWLCRAAGVPAGAFGPIIIAACALIATILEAFSPVGTDNLTVPLVVAVLLRSFS